jgi:HPt (histidine-containing phosphotransfer) domain-containing protein
LAGVEPGGAVDFSYLESFTAGDVGVVLEVLDLFAGQARSQLEALSAGAPDGWREMAHTIKGAARGIGANRLGDLADKAEFGSESDLEPMRIELARVVAAIEGYRAAQAQS